MASFYFHVTVGERFYRDEDGSAHYFDLVTAKTYAERLARELRTADNFRNAVIHVLDSRGREVFTVGVAERGILSPAGVR